MENTQYWLLYRGVYHCLGLAGARAYSRSRRAYWREIENTRGRRRLKCALCKKRIPWKKKTIDHIVPKVIIYEYELFGLLTDHRNFQPAHHECNVKRDVLTVEDLPDNIKAKILSVSTVSPKLSSK